VSSSPRISLVSATERLTNYSRHSDGGDAHDHDDWDETDSLDDKPGVTVLSKDNSAEPNGIVLPTRGLRKEDAAVRKRR
jgi:hypothetical protein